MTDVAATSPWWNLRSRFAADGAILLGLAVASGYLAWTLTGLHGQIPTLATEKADDVWFEGDVKRVFDNMTSRGGDHHRSQVHPLFSLFGYEITRLFRLLTGLSPLDSVRITIASAAAAWITLFFVLLRLLRCRKPDAALFTIAAATSAAAMFWTAVPETYLFGSATIVAVLVTVALSEHRRIPPWLDIAAAALALSMLVTNWMFGLISLGVRYKIKDALQMAANALVVVVVLWVVQKHLITSAHFFFGDHEGIASTEPATVPAVFFLDTLVMPDIQRIPNDQPWLWQKFSVQHALTWKLTSAGIVALFAWVLLFLAGVWAALTLEPLRKFRLILGIALAGQLALHLIYGNETFLYTLDWLPLLVTTAALATLTRLRRFVLAVVCIFIVTAGLHNYAELSFTLDVLASKEFQQPP